MDYELALTCICLLYIAIIYQNAFDVCPADLNATLVERSQELRLPVSIQLLELSGEVVAVAQQQLLLLGVGAVRLRPSVQGYGTTDCTTLYSLIFLKLRSGSFTIHSIATLLAPATHSMLCCHRKQ